MLRPSTTRSASYQRKASGLSLSGPSKAMRSATSVKNSMMRKLLHCRAEEDGRRVLHVTIQRDDAVVMSIDVEGRAQGHRLERRAFGCLPAGELEALHDGEPIGVFPLGGDEGDRQWPIGPHLHGRQHAA